MADKAKREARSEALRQNWEFEMFWREASLHDFSFALLSHFELSIIGNRLVTLPVKVKFILWKNLNFRENHHFWILQKSIDFVLISYSKLDFRKASINFNLSSKLTNVTSWPDRSLCNHEFEKAFTIFCWKRHSACVLKMAYLIIIT